MSNLFTEGKEISLLNGSSAKVEKFLGEGGQGSVYQVSLDGQQYALKWYHEDSLKNPVEFYDNLKKNINKGAPGSKKSFIWPLYLTEKREGSFGYVMKLIPPEYKSFGAHFLLAKVHFKNLSAAINATLQITNGFKDLHREGFSYQDINDGNFSINPKTGDVLICDNDNVAPDKQNLGIKGKIRYMAPEVVRSILYPDNKTDRFSLAVVLFCILFGGHPLEGQRFYNAPCLTEELEVKFYGKEPTFIFDPKDASNRPNPAVNRNVIKYWALFPQFIRDIFIKAFSFDSIRVDENDTDKARINRVSDTEWENAFLKLRDQIITCECNEETFFNPECQDNCCLNCKRKIPNPPLFYSPNGKSIVPLFPGKKLYQFHIDKHSDDFETVCSEVVHHPKDPSVWGLKNLTSDYWMITRKDGKNEQLAPGRSEPLILINQIKFKGDNIGQIKS